MSGVLRTAVARVGLVGAWVLLAAPPRSGADEDAGTQAARPAAPIAGSSDPEPEQELAARVRLASVLEIVLARNPDLLEAEARARSAGARASAAFRLPDLELKYEQWGVPLSRPAALDEADTLMFGLRQSLPPDRSARGREARADAAIASAGRRERALDLVAQVRRAFADYVRAHTEYRIHLDHIAISERLVELARVKYEAGRGSQQDALRTAVELTQRHAEVISIEQDLQIARSLLNTLMARPPDAPLGPPEPARGALPAFDHGEIERRLERERPELVAAAEAVTRSDARVAGARRAARVPTFTVGADYWLMPTREERHAYGAMISVSLPWLNPARREELRAAEEARAADREGLRASRNVALHQLREAAARHRAAEETAAIIERQLLPRARRSVEAAQAAFQAAQADSLSVLDAARSLLEVRIQQARAAARLESSRADLERAAGIGVEATEGGKGHE